MAFVRVAIATLLWVSAVALAVVTLTTWGDPCKAPDWTQWTPPLMGLFVAAATFASLRIHVAAALLIAFVVGACAWGGFLLLLILHWFNNCV